MQGFVKKSIFWGIMLSLISSLQAIDTASQCESLFVINQTDHYVLLRFCNEHRREQQQFPMNPGEHLYVKVNVGVMQNLFTVKVSITDRKYKKDHDYSKVENQGVKLKGVHLTKEIDYERNTSIVGLQISMNPDLDLKWRYQKDYVSNIPEDMVER